MNIKRISIFFFFLLGLAGASYYSQKLMMIYVSLVLALLLLSEWYYRKLPTSLPCTIELPAASEKGEKITGYLHVIQNGRLPIFHGEAKIRFRSLYYKQEKTINLDIMLMGKEEGIAAFDLDLPYVGILEVILEEARVYNLFGTRKKNIITPIKKEIMVLPDTREINMHIINLGSLDPESEEVKDAVYGYDPGSYQGIRPYREGDSMKYIHWKLTGKTEEIMVRELGIPSGKEPKLYLETGIPDFHPKRIDHLIEEYFSLSMALIDKGYPHILCWKNKGEAWEEYRVDNLPMLEELLEPIFHIEFWKNTEKRDTWIYYMDHDENDIYGFYHEGEEDYLEYLTGKERF